MPWYVGYEHAAAGDPSFDDPASDLGGRRRGLVLVGAGRRLHRRAASTGVDVKTDNTEPDHPDTPANPEAVPSVFNGDFESGTLQDRQPRRAHRARSPAGSTTAARPPRTGC